MATRSGSPPHGHNGMTHLRPCAGSHLQAGGCVQRPLDGLFRRLHLAGMLVALGILPSQEGACVFHMSQLNAWQEEQSLVAISVVEKWSEISLAPRTDGGVGRQHLYCVRWGPTTAGNTCTQHGHKKLHAVPGVRSPPPAAAFTREGARLAAVAQGERLAARATRSIRPLLTCCALFSAGGGSRLG